MSMPGVDRDANAALRARFDDVYARYAQMRDGVGELQRRLAELQVTITSPDRSVKVTVGPQGQLVDLQLSERSYEHRPERLAEVISETLRRAQTAAGTSVRHLMTELIPDEAGISEVLASGDISALLRRHDDNMGYSRE